MQAALLHDAQLSRRLIGRAARQIQVRQIYTASSRPTCTALPMRTVGREPSHDLFRLGIAPELLSQARQPIRAPAPAVAAREAQNDVRVRSERVRVHSAEENK